MARGKKQQLNNKSGDFIYKVRGPPWARKVTKLKKTRHIDRPKDRNINNVHKEREKVFNDTDVNKTTVSPKLKCFYTNADQLFNKLPEVMVRT